MSYLGGLLLPSFRRASGDGDKAQESTNYFCTSTILPPITMELNVALRALKLVAKSTTITRSLATQATPAPTSNSELVWSPGTQRTGVLARKHGMTCLWDADGLRVPVTVLQVSRTATPFSAEDSLPAQTHDLTLSFSKLVRTSSLFPPKQLDEVQVITSNSYPSTSTLPPRHTVTLGCSPRRAKTVSSALLGQFRKGGIEPKMRIAEFPVTENAVVLSG